MDDYIDVSIEGMYNFIDIIHDYSDNISNILSSIKDLNSTLSIALDCNRNTEVYNIINRIYNEELDSHFIYKKILNDVDNCIKVVSELENV